MCKTHKTMNIRVGMCKTENFHIVYVVKTLVYGSISWHIVVEDEERVQSSQS